MYPKHFFFLQWFFFLVAAQAFLRNSPSSKRRPLWLFLASATPVDDDEATRMIRDMAGFFQFMVDPEKQRFYYECRQGERFHQIHPIRDLAAAWDATKALPFLGPNETHRDDALFKQAILHTLQSYSVGPTPIGRGFMVHNLPEPSNIAHSALMLLSYTGALRLGLLNPNDASSVLNGLAQGILSMQQENGAFATEFHNTDSVYQGIDFYPGEAMLALVEIHQFGLDVPGLLDATTQEAIVPTLHRALDFYSHYYRTQEPATNYNIWQIQAFARLEKTKTPPILEYITEMCHDIVSSKAWKYELARGRSFYPNLQTVEIACGLDALLDGIGAADPPPGLWLRQAQNAIDFLRWSLDKVPENVKGGLGYGGVLVMEQRLDVTGHAMSALTKWKKIQQTL
jgi:hypothetical protein